MRIQIGDLPPATSTPEANGWMKIISPSSGSVHLYSWIIGIAILTSLLALIIVFSLFEPSPTRELEAGQSTPWVAVVLTLVLAVPAHEFLHALFHPNFGLSSSTIFVAWPRKLRFGIYFEGRMSRRRWLAMRLAPLVVLSIVPTILLASPTGIWHNLTIETTLAVLLLVNALGSGSDVLGAAWVIFNIPKGSSLAFCGGRAYWKPD